MDRRSYTTVNIHTCV